MRSTELPAAGDQDPSAEKTSWGPGFAIRNVRVSDALFPWCREISKDYCQYSPDLDLVFGSSFFPQSLGIVSKDASSVASGLGNSPMQSRVQFCARYDVLTGFRPSKKPLWSPI
jgi:hypothetical protein